MPIILAVDATRQRVRMMLAGNFAFDEWQAALQHMCANRVWHYSTVFEPVDLHGLPPTSADVRRMVNILVTLTRAHGPRGRVAIVARDESSFGMARMYELLTERLPMTVQVFRNSESADAWLDSSTQPIASSL